MLKRTTQQILPPAFKGRRPESASLTSELLSSRFTCCERDVTLADRKRGQEREVVGGGGWVVRVWPPPVDYCGGEGKQCAAAAVLRARCGAGLREWEEWEDGRDLGGSARAGLLVTRACCCYSPRRAMPGQHRCQPNSELCFKGYLRSSMPCGCRHVARSQR